MNSAETAILRVIESWVCEDQRQVWIKAGITACQAWMGLRIGLGAVVWQT